MMDIQVEILGNRQIIHFNGKITAEHCPALDSRLDSILQNDIPKVVLDFEHVPYMDSKGVELIVRFIKRLRDQNWEHTVINPTRRVQDLFHLFRLDKFMNLTEE